MKAAKPHLETYGLVPLRVALSLIFIGHGAQRLFVMGISGTSRRQRSPRPVVISVELLGGIAVLLGIWARWAALLLSTDRLVALLLIHAKAGLLRPGGFEFVFVLLASTLSTAVMS